MRTVQVGWQEKFNEINHDNAKNVADVVGYLSTWACHSEKYCRVELFLDGNGDIHATYKDAAGNITYTMFGQRDTVTGVFSTHS